MGDFVYLNTSIVEIDIVDAKLVGELNRQSVQNYGNTLCPLRYNIQKCFVTIMDAVFKRLVAHCFFNKTAELVHLLTGCSKQVKEVKPKKVLR